MASAAVQSACDARQEALQLRERAIARQVRLPAARSRAPLCALQAATAAHAACAAGSRAVPARAGARGGGRRRRSSARAPWRTADRRATPAATSAMTRLPQVCPRRRRAPSLCLAAFGGPSGAHACKQGHVRINVRRWRLPAVRVGPGAAACRAGGLQVSQTAPPRRL